MEPPEEISWLQYYQAVKQGDLTTVQRSCKNFRLPLTLNLSALELATIYGHVTLVSHFLSQCQQDDREFVATALLQADYDCAKILVESLESLEGSTVLEEDRIMHYFDIILAAIENGYVSCARFLCSNPPPNSLLDDLLCAAFRSGKVECMKFVVDELFKSDDIYSLSEMPELLFHIALNDLAKVKSYIERNRDWAKIPEDVKVPSVFDIAAVFGHVDILEFLIRESKTLEVSILISIDLDSTMSLAIHHNRVDVVKYLFDWVKRKPPFDYADFRFNEAFNYLWEKTKVGRKTQLPVGLKESWKNFIRLDPPNSDVDGYDPLVSVVPHRITREAENHYKSLLEIGDTICRGSYNYGSIYMDVLSQQNVEAALCLRNRVRKFSCKTTSNYHECLKRALRCLLRPTMVDDPFLPSETLSEILPSPIIVELALCTLDGELQCACGELKPMDYLLELDPQHKINDFPVRESLPLSTLTDGLLIIMNLMIKHGFSKPDSDRIWPTIIDYFQRQEPLRLVHAARILTILRTCRLDVSSLCIESCASWFLFPWKERDIFLTEFLLAISANESLRSVEFECFLVYLLDSEKRADHFFHCLWQTQIQIHDIHMANGEVIELPSFSKVLEASSSRKVPSLYSHCRLALHKYSMKMAAREKSFVSARSILRKLSEQLPEQVRDFLRFPDVYETLKFEARHCLGSVLVEKIVFPAVGDAFDDIDGSYHSDSELSVDSDDN